MTSIARRVGSICRTHKCEMLYYFVSSLCVTFVIAMVLNPFLDFAFLWKPQIRKILYNKSVFGFDKRNAPTDRQEFIICARTKGSIAKTSASCNKLRNNHHNQLSLGHLLAAICMVHTPGLAFVLVLSLPPGWHRTHCLTL